VQLACRVLDISESGYDERKTRAPSERAARHAWLTDLIRQIHLDSRGIDSSQRRHVTNALGMAIDSDQGTVFGSWAFTQRAKDAGLLPSMGSVGDCYDNSMIESFWSRMQVEFERTQATTVA
jgi:transposase InsO family protein